MEKEKTNQFARGLVTAFMIALIIILFFIGFAGFKATSVKQQEVIRNLAEQIDAQLPDSLPKINYIISFTDNCGDISFTTKMRPVIVTTIIKRIENGKVTIRPSAILQDSITNQIITTNVEKLEIEK